MNVELKIATFLEIGREIQSSTENIKHLSFEINEVPRAELEQLAAKYDAPLMAPNLMYNHYRTTILDGCTKIILRSPKYNVSYQIMD